MANPHTRRIDSSIGPIALILLTIAGFAVGAPALAQSSRTADEVVAIRELELKPDIDIAEFERFVTSTYNPGWDGALTGSGATSPKRTAECTRGAMPSCSSSIP